MVGSKSEREKLEKRVMRGLLGGLRYPTDYDSHPLAAEEVIEALTADVKVRAPPELKPEGSGGWALAKALRLLTLDRFRLQLLQSEPDRPLTAGLILVWLTYVQPAVEGVTPPSLPEAVNKCTSLEDLGELLEEAILQTGKRKWEFQWTTDPFVKLRKRDRKKEGTGSRTAGNYRDKALLYLLQRIERVAAGLNRRVEELLPELAGARPQVSGITPGIIPDWATRLSQCASDYRSYELREIERLLGEQGLSPSFDWLLARQVYHPADQPEGGGARVASLANICQPGSRTALLDYRGSGTTTALLWLSSQYCTSTADVEPVILRLDAQEYFRSAVGESPYYFLARRIYGSGRDVSAQRQTFESVLREADVICLADNLARISFEDQVRVGRWLQLCSATVFTAPPGISDEDLVNIGGEDVVRAVLNLLEEVQIRQFITEFGTQVAPGFDGIVALRLAHDMPDIATLPLGLTILCEQVRLYQGNCASITARFISELFQRDGKPPPEWYRDSCDLPPELRLPMRLAVPMYGSPENWSRIGDISLDFDEEWALEYLVPGLRNLWPVAKTSPLLIRIGPQTYRFLNREVFGFLVAMASAKRAFSQCGWWSILDMFKQSIVGVVNRHYQAWIESSSENWSGGLASRRADK